jgi:hypothetical protein
MSAHNRKPADEQLALPFEQTPPAIVALRMVDHRVAGVSRMRWQQIRELACAILWCGVHDGCRASVAKLMKVANANRLAPVIGSRRAFFRVRQCGITLGVLVDEPSYDNEGRTFSERSVNLERVRELVKLTQNMAAANRRAKRQRKATGSSQGEKNGTHLALTWHSPSIALKPLKPNNPNLVDFEGDHAQTIQAGRGPARAGGSAIVMPDAAAIRGMAERIERLMGGCHKRQDWLLAVHAAALVPTLSENWLGDAIGAVRNKRPPAVVPWAYLQRCLDEGAAKLGVDFTKAKRQLRLPFELLERRTEADGAKRLCTTGRGEP